MIKIIGTNHLDSKEKIIKIIESEKPDILGVELCELRVNTILNENKVVYDERKNEKESLLSKITNKIKEKAEKEKLDYGSDMKTVLRYSQEKKIPLVLVDMPILKIQELFSKIPINEQQGFTKELTEFEQQGELDKEVDEEQVLINLKTKYPIAFEFLVNMRNVYITNQILKSMINYPNKKILVFLGKGHCKQVELMLF